MALEPKLIYREYLTDKYPHIAKTSGEIIRCIKCGLCRAVCPTLIETLSEPEGARGRITLVEAVLDGRLELSDIFADRISTCINCKACVEACPSGVRVDDIILAARAELVSRGKFSFLKRLILRGLLKRGRLLPPVGRIASLIQRALLKLSPEGSALRLLLPAVRIDKERRLPVFAPKSFRKQIPEIMQGSSGASSQLRVAYFVGCACDLIYINVARSVVDVLTKFGVEVVIPPLQSCCGTPVFNAGDFATARDMAKKNIDTFMALDVESIVVSCASCGLALKREYSKVLGLDTLGFSEKVMDVSEFIVKKIGLDVLKAAVSSAAGNPRATEAPKGPKTSKTQKPPKIPETAARDITVTYHDPCHLKRGQGVRDEPREIIRAIPGVKLVEMPEADRCCGGGGLYSFTHYEMSKAVASRKVKAIRETGAEIVLTSCPSCILQLTDALAQAELPIKVMHVMELLSQALRAPIGGTGAARVSELQEARTLD